MSQLTHRSAFAIDLDETGLVVNLARRHPECGPLVIGQRLDRKDEAEDRVASVARRAFLPPHRVSKHQRQLATAAKEPDALDGAGQRGITHASCRRQRVGRQQHMVEGQRVGPPLRLVVHAAALGVHLLYLGTEPDIDPDLPVDLRQLFGHPPDARFDETIVTIEDGTGVHHWEREGGIRLVERYRPALGHRHPHINLSVLRSEVVIEQFAGAAADPQTGERVTQVVPRRGKTGRRGAAIALLQIVHDARLIRTKAFNITAFAPARF